MKRFRNPCHSMLGPAIATHLSNSVRCRTRPYVNDMSSLCLFHSMYHSFSRIKDCVHVEVKKVFPPLCFHLFYNTPIADTCIIDQYPDLLSKTFYCCSIRAFYRFFLRQVCLKVMKVGMAEGFRSGTAPGSYDGSLLGESLTVARPIPLLPPVTTANLF